MWFSAKKKKTKNKAFEHLSFINEIQRVQHRLELLFFHLSQVANQQFKCKYHEICEHSRKI